MTAVWLSAQARLRLETELAELLTHRDVDSAAADYDDEVIAAWLERKSRIREIQELLSSSAIASPPPDDGVAEPGMVLTIHYDGTDERETFLLGVRGAESADIEVYSPNSPLGQALLGATPGEQRSYRLPSGARQGVTLAAAVPLDLFLSAPTA